MPSGTVGQFLAANGWGPLRGHELGEYFNFVKACKAVSRELAGDPLFSWDKVVGKEIELGQNPESNEREEDWKKRTVRMLKITGGNLAAYAVKEGDLEEKGGRVFVKRDRQDECQIDIIGVEPEELTMELQELPDKGTLIYLDIDTQALDAQFKALERLQKNPHPKFHRPLLGLFDDRGLDEEFWPQTAKRESAGINWQILNPKFPGAAAQMEFVEKALSTPDFVLLKGPPGAGKTTAIAELILQVAATQPEARMLLTASTHVAIDNVLSQLAQHADKATCVRIASKQTAKHVTDPRVVDMLLPRIVNRERTRIAKELAGKTAVSAKRFRATIESPNEVHLKELIITSATPAAGTPRGILQHPFLKTTGQGYHAFLLNPVPFDYIIVDESSKTSLLEFMVPAIYARRWVIVGDDCQLPPYMGRPDVGAALRVLSQESNDELVDKVAGKLVRWRERYFQKLNRGDEEIADGGMREAANTLRRIFLPSIYGLLTKGHGLSKGSVLGEGLPEAALKKRSVSLDYQNRMHPDISEFPRKSFYGTKAGSETSGTLLLDNPNLKDRSWSFSSRFRHRTVWWDVPRKARDAHGDKDEDNSLEAFVVAHEALDYLQKDPALSVAIICFHKKQRRLIQRAYEDLSKELLRKPRSEVEFLTVDSCQGREADVVLVSFALESASTFMRDPNRLNVAITRARHQLILVGNHEGMLRAKKGWVGPDYLRELAEHHRDKLHTNHDLLKQAKDWRPAPRENSRGTPEGPRSVGQSKGKPWRTHTKSGPPDRNAKPFNGLNLDDFKR